MEHTKEIKVMRPNYHSHQNELKIFGPNEGLRAIFGIEKIEFMGRNERPDEIEIDTNFIRIYEYSVMEKVEFISHMFNISEPNELMKALEQEENNRVLELEVRDSCMLSVLISVEGVAGKKLLEMMKGHIALLYALHSERLAFHHISVDSHRPSIKCYSPMQVLNEGLKIRLFPGVVDKYDLIEKVSLLRRMYESARSHESGLDFIENFFKRRDFERYTFNKHDDVYKKTHEDMAIEFMRSLLSNKYYFNIGRKGLLNLFYNDRPQDEMILELNKNYNDW